MSKSNYIINYIINSQTQAERNNQVISKITMPLSFFEQLKQSKRKTYAFERNDEKLVVHNHHVIPTVISDCIFAEFGG